jgi:PAS domain S-box-containing protein
LFNPITVVAISLLYLGCLLLLALAVERNPDRWSSVVNRPLVYALSLGVYCTAWSFYGSVGSAANNGLIFITVYLGPTLAVFFWWQLLRKLVRLKDAYRITSIADFISARYGKSQALAALATLLAFFGSVPYIALQLKAVVSSFEILSHGGVSSGDSAAATSITLTILMILFTCLIGARRIDPTERHPGMVMVVATQSIIKLVALLAVGVLATWIINDGLADIFSHATLLHEETAVISGKAGSPLLVWGTYMLLSMAAIQFLPRQFHLAVVENCSENQIRTAMWMLPVYMLLLTFFVYPIAIAGLHQGFSAAQADTFVLTLPLAHGNPLLALAAFIGGLSAATGMIMIAGMTVANMLTNHVLVPLENMISPLLRLQPRLLFYKRFSITVFLLLGYLFERTVGESLMLIDIGMISFAAAFQFAPPILGGIFWSRGNREGALLGMGAGFVVWLIFLVLPAVNSAGLSVIGMSSVSAPNVINLAGLAVDSVSLTVILSLIFNTGLYILGSLVFETDESETVLAQDFVRSLPYGGQQFEIGKDTEAFIDQAQKKREVFELLCRYFPSKRAMELVDSQLLEIGSKKNEALTIYQLIELHDRVEKNLAGAVGAASAHLGMSRGISYNEVERKALAEAYEEVLINLNLSPTELRKKLDYYQEKEHLLLEQASELEDKVAELNEEIEQRGRAEQALEDSERNYSEVFNATLEAIVILDPADGKILDANQSFHEKFGFGEQLPVELTLAECIDQDSLPSESLLQQIMDETMQSGEGLFECDCLAGGDCNGFWCEASLQKIELRGRRLLLAMLRDISERRQADKAFRRQLEFSSTLLETIPIPVFHKNNRLVYTGCNAAFEKIVGLPREKIIGKQVHEVWPDKLADIYEQSDRELLANKGSTVFETQLRAADGKLMDIMLYKATYQNEAGKVLGIVCGIMDLTERKQMEVDRNKAERMESIGLLAGGIAHDFNNLLTALLGNISLSRLMADESGNEQLDDLLSEAEKAGKRAGGLTKQLLTFSKGGSPVKEIVALEGLVRESAGFALRGSNVSCQFNIQPGLWATEVDPGQISQVLNNLVINAKQAMPSGGGITISTANTTFDKPMPGSGLIGRYVLVEISDQGEGIDEANLPRIFDPYYTTKPKGSGLGLPTCYSIIKRHSGHIDVASKVGEGTVFSIYLPATSGETTSAPEDSTEATSRSARLLVMDDEEPIRRVVTAMLEVIGHSADSAADGEQALRMYHEAMEAGNAYDVVILDLTIPGGMGGRETIEKLRELDPKVRALVSSGYSNDPVVASFTDFGFHGVVSKPYQVKELQAEISRIMD